MPLETAAAAPRADVDPLVYMPPALRYPITTPPGSTFPLTLPLANLTPHLPCLNIANALTLSSAPICHGVVAALWFWLAALSLVLDLPSEWAAA